MAGLTKAEREARAFLQSLDAKPLAGARKRLMAKTDKRTQRPKRTPEQKKAQTQAARAAIIKNRGVSIALRTAHWIGGVNYGPGHVTVPADLAPCLLENERRVEYNNQRFDGSQEAYVGPFGRAVRVPAGTLANSMGNAPEAFAF